MVRPGIALYGYYLPFERADASQRQKSAARRQIVLHLEDADSLAARSSAPIRPWDTAGHLCD